PSLSRPDALPLTAEDLPVRPRVPEFTRLILSSDGSLWLERFAVPSDEWKEWLQLDLNLQPKAVLRIPRLYHVHDLRSDFALIEQVDSLGVERLFAVPIASSGTSNNVAHR